jgi:NDP-sugar pyrophosphorylase family protein
MILLNQYINSFPDYFEQQEREPWEVAKDISQLLFDLILQLDSNFLIENNIAIHRTATIEPNVIIKPPAVIGKNCFVGSNSYLRQGVFLADSVKIGTGCELKSSMIFENSSIAHFNFIGDSIIGSDVNFEAGSITANHFNERQDKRIFIRHNSEVIETNSTKFGSLVGDGSKVGANAVLSPGTFLPKNTIVKRLELVDQTSK